MAKFENLDLLQVGNTIQLAGAIWVGGGKTYLCLFPGEDMPMPVDTLEMTIDEWQKFLRQTDIMETEVLAASADGKVAKALIRKSTRQIAQHVSWAVYRRDRRCRYCGRDDVPLTVDHLVLWENGGPSTEGNLLSACRKCNKTRGNTEFADWLNHPYYKRVSQNLPPGIQQANLDIVATLDAIPRMVHKPTRRK